MQRSKKDVSIRLFAAFIPAFFLTNTLGIFLTLILPGDKVTNLAYVITFAFLFYSATVMWIFHTEKLQTIGTWLTLGILITGAGSYILY